MKEADIPYSLTLVAEIYIAMCLLCFLYILIEQRREPAPMMRVMLWVWPITMLWAGPLGIWAYRINQKRTMMRMTHHHPADQPAMRMSGNGMSGMTALPSCPLPWQSVMVGTLHCGAGCTLADLAGPWLFRLAPFALFGSVVYGEWTLEYLLALIAGIAFQYAGLASGFPERGLPLLWRAFKVDVLSLTAWQIGMYGWMAVSMFVLLGMVSPAQPVFWLMMQIGMLAGFMTAFPMNWLLMRLGIKEGM